MGRTIQTPLENAALQRECIERVHHYVDLAKTKLGVYLPYPRVQFDIRGTTAGTAYAGKNLIRFSPTLLRENIEDFLVNTTGHEVAHLIARAKFGAIDPHGNEWKRVMWAFGLRASRCHSYDVSNVPTMAGRVRREHVVKRNNDGSVSRLGSGAIVTEL